MDQLKDLINQLNTLSPDELETLIRVTKEIKEKKTSPIKTPPNPSAAENFFDYYKKCGIDEVIINEAWDEIEGLDCHSQGVDQPGIILIGENYYYSAKTKKNLVAVSFQDAPKTAKLVEALNNLHGTSFNSVLVNRYRTFKHHIKWHKDDEPMLDLNSPIGALSRGAARQLQVALTKDNNSVIRNILLHPGSFLMMKAGFQDRFYHQLAKGRRSMEPKETGTRDSMTFRTILPQQSDAVSEVKKTTPPSAQTLSPPPQQPEERPKLETIAEEGVTDIATVEDEVSEVEVEKVASEEAAGPDEDEVNTERRRKSKLKTPVVTSSGDNPAVCDAVVFGSSLVKDLNPKLLAKYGKKFTVLSHSSAHIEDIIEDIKAAKNKGTIACDGVKTAFFVCGGNDVENLPGDHKLDNIKEDLVRLMTVAKDVFPSAAINIVSLIPRRVNKYGQEHVWLMHDINNFLSIECKKRQIRFVNAYSCYIRSSGRLNYRLFNGSKLHFSDVGNAVLGKLIIAVTHRPYK